MNKRELVKDYLTFSKKERLAIFGFAMILALLFFVPNLIHTSRKVDLEIDTTYNHALVTLQKNRTVDTQYQYRRINTNYGSKEKEDPSTAVTHKLFYFDPNTLSVEGWQKLGLRERTIKTIGNYLSKRGHFYKPEDLQRIYGLQQKEYERLFPFIRIQPLVSAKGTQLKANEFHDNVYIDHKRDYEYAPVDINKGDANDFIALPAIGEILAARIIHFREKLGGFYSINQIGETYGLTDSSFQKIKPYLKIDITDVKKININTAGEEQLKLHPYIRWGLARAIIEYRNQHGRFSSLEELKKIMIITDEVYTKITPYLTTE